MKSDQRGVLPAILFIICAAAISFWHNAVYPWRMLHYQEAFIEKVVGPERAATLKPLLIDPDSEHWLGMARRMLSGEGVVIRFTQVDNAPFGREIHWSSSFAWWLALGSTVGSWFCGEAPIETLKAFAPWANVLAFAVAVLSFAVIFWRSLGPLPAGAFIAAWVSSPAVIWDFGFGIADHHGFHDIAAIWTCLPMIIAALTSGRENSPSTAGTASLSGAAVLAGTGAGVGLWLSATTQFVVSFTFLFAAAGVELFRALRGRGAGENAIRPAVDPASWLAFGLSAAVSSTILHIVEYGSPVAAELRLEVNNPIYSLSVLGGGVMVWGLGKLGNGPRTNGGWLWGAAALCGGAALVAPILCFVFGPSEWHAMRDPVLARVHAVGKLNSPLFATAGFSGEPLVEIAPILLGLTIAAGYAATFLLRGRQHDGVDALLWILAPAVALATLLLGFHIRWGGLAATLAALVVAVLVKLLLDREMRRPGHVCSVLAGSFLVSGFLAAYSNQAKINSHLITHRAGFAIATLQIADCIREDLGAAPSRLMAMRGFVYGAEWLGCRLDVPVVSSRYWENLDGLRAEAEFFGSTDLAAAERIARDRGLTHVLAVTKPESITLQNYLQTGEIVRENPAPNLATLLSQPVPNPPPWLELMEECGKQLPSSLALRLYRVKFND